MTGGGKPVYLHPKAQAELHDSVVFYREHGGEPLVDHFKAAIVSGLRAVSEHPLRFPALASIKEARHVLLGKFPFSIIYIDRPKSVWVIAVAHGSRKPGYWQGRIH